MNPQQFKPRRKKTPIELALDVLTECEAMLADMRREVMGIAKGEAKLLPPPKIDEAEEDE